MPSPLQPNGLLQNTLISPSPNASKRAKPLSSTPRRPGKTKVVERTRLKPVSGDVFYSASTASSSKTSLSKSVPNPSTLASVSGSDSRGPKRRRISGEYGQVDKENRDGSTGSPWVPKAWHRAPGYGLLPSSPGARAGARDRDRNRMGVKEEPKTDSPVAEEDDFMKHLLADIELDPTGGISPDDNDDRDDVDDDNENARSPGGKRKRIELDGEVDEYGDQGWDWEGLMGPGLEDSLEVSEKVVLDKGPVKRESRSIEIQYEDERPGTVRPALQNDKTKPVSPCQSALDKAGENDLDEFFPFDFPLSQESFLDEPGPSVPLSRYPILHPLVHPLRPPTTTITTTDKSAGSIPFRPTPWARCSVTGILDAEDVESRWGWGEKVLLLTDVKTGRRYKVNLREEAAEMLVLVGDIANIISPLIVESSSSARTLVKENQLGSGFVKMHPSLPANPTVVPSFGISVKEDPDTTADQDGSPIEIIVSHKYPENYFIHHPDFLLPMTTIVGALGCRRKPLVQSLLKSGAHNATTKPLLYGNILHELLQECLQTQEFDPASMKRILEHILQRPQMQLDMWAAELSVEDVRVEVWEKISTGLLNFGPRWVGRDPAEDALMHNSSSMLALSGLHDIEESIWSPKWGMKGKVDASVHANVVISTKPERGVSTVKDDQPMPFEIKTGRAVGVMEHRAQTMLYTLLMEERYQTKIDSGLLYYTQTDTMLEVKAARPEIRSLLAARNELAGYLARKRIVQETRRARASQKSEHGTQKTQLSPHKSQRAGNTQEIGMMPSGIPLDIEDIGILPPTTDNPRDCRNCYASDGCMLYRKTVDAAPVHADDPLAEIYERKAGHLDEADAVFFTKWEHLITLEEQDIVQHKNQTWTMTAAERERSGRCFADMVIRDHIDQSETTLSKIARHIYTFTRDETSTMIRGVSFLNGHIGKNDPVSLSIEPDLISIAVGFVVELTPTEVKIGTNQKLDVDALLERTGRLDRHGGDYRPIFRIDKDEMLSGAARMRNNLAQLFYSEDAGGDTKRRDLVVHLQEPRFEDVWAPDANEIPDHLNADQKNAMSKVLTAKDYACILGMPGTGKTTTIAEIILALVKRGKSVLLTSYTHSAVDTILTKLVNSDHKILRLGNIEKVHPDVRHLTLEAFTDPSSISQLEDILMSPQIVATTCLSIDHPIFIRRHFDYCIVDEASQITLPTCLGPLRFADTFVLVGDHFQLPPIVKNLAARRGGLDTSLFRLLTDAHPEATVDLGYQYRMNEDIMALSNKLIYSGRLKCGSEQVRDQNLVLPKRETTCQCTLSKVLEASIRCVFVNTDKLAARESRLGDLVQNEMEGKLVDRLVSSLVAGGIKQEDIGVITPYRQQIKLLSSLVHRQHPLVEVLTADKSQGRDKDCIVISMVRSNDIGNVGELLRDWRRINVSLTRAKKKLVIFGSRGTLQSDRLLSEFFDLMDERNWTVDLLKSDEECLCGRADTIEP